MRPSIVIGTAVIFMAVCSGCASRLNDFSADMITKSGRITFSGKVYVSGEKMRTEMQGATSITRPDKKVAWVLLPEQMMYMEQPLDPRNLVATTDKPQGEVERTRVGQEMVDGKVCQKFKVVYTYQGRKDAVYQWICAGMKMPVKTASLDGAWSMEFRNLQYGPQQASLFEVPAGYKRFSQGVPAMKDVVGGALRNIF